MPKKLINNSDQGVTISYATSWAERGVSPADWNSKYPTGLHIAPGESVKVSDELHEILAETVAALKPQTDYTRHFDPKDGIGRDERARYVEWAWKNGGGILR